MDNTEDILHISIFTKWADGEMVCKSGKDTADTGLDYDIKITGGLDKLSTTERLDYLTDLKWFIDHKIDEVHKEMSPRQSAVATAILGCPPSFEQRKAMDKGKLATDLIDDADKNIN